MRVLEKHFKGKHFELCSNLPNNFTYEIVHVLESLHPLQKKLKINNFFF